MGLTQVWGCPRLSCSSVSLATSVCVWGGPATHLCTSRNAWLGGHELSGTVHCCFLTAVCLC